MFSLFFFCTAKILGLPPESVLSGKIKKDSLGVYSITHNDKSAYLDPTRLGRIEFSASVWPNMGNDIRGKELKLLAFAFVTLKAGREVKVQYHHKEQDPDIDIFLHILLKKYQST